MVSDINCFLVGVVGNVCAREKCESNGMARTMASLLELEGAELLVDYLPDDFI